MQLTLVALWLRPVVMDTSAVLDERLAEKLGSQRLEETIEKLVEVLSRARVELGIEFLAPPSILEELRRQLEIRGLPASLIDGLIKTFTPKTPALYSLTIPAILVKDIVSEFSARLSRGLRIAEEFTRQALTGSLNEPELIRRLRLKYREATRKNLVDSVEDFEVVMLAYELNAILVTNDEGVRRFAEKLGITVIDSPWLIDMLLTRLGRKV